MTHCARLSLHHHLRHAALHQIWRPAVTGTVLLCAGAVISTFPPAAASEPGTRVLASKVTTTPASGVALVSTAAELAPAWAAVARATQDRQLVFTGAAVSMGDAEQRLTASWRGTYPALLQAVDDVQAALPALSLSRLELRRASDTGEIEARVIFKLPRQPVVAAR